MKGYGIDSVSKPLKKRTVSYSLQLRETSQQRQLDHFDKYQKMWDNYEQKVEKYFVRQDDIKKGRASSKMDEGAIRQDLKKNMKNLMY